MRSPPSGFHLILALCVLLAARGDTWAQKEAHAPPARPNVLLVLIDDMGWMDLRCQGNERLETPNIDRLASQGMLPELRVAPVESTRRRDPIGPAQADRTLRRRLLRALRSRR
jgi:hypothetical protein